MKKAFFVLLVFAIAWVGYSRYEDRHRIRALGVADPVPTVAREPASNATYSCDGRVYCSQMTSCEEATYFLGHCPGTKMDGDHDGIPCERQWCTTR